MTTIAKEKTQDLVREQAQEKFEKEISVEFVNRSAQVEKKSFSFSSTKDPNVNAGVLKHKFLSWFDESPVILEDEPEVDENQSFHLVGFDHKGDATSFRDGEQVDINTYQRFEISPRTAGGV